MTFFNHYNYGACLQNYALQEILKKWNYEVETINYKIDYSSESKFHNDIEKNKVNEVVQNNIINKLINKPKEIIRERNFSKFIENYIHATVPINKESFEQCENLFDLVISGSDQVWSRLIINDNANQFTLKCLNNIKKASYGASCGSLKYLDSEILDGIKKLDYVTVREADLNEYLNEKKIVCKQVCDPTLLLTKKEWIEKLDLIDRNNNSIYCYFLDSGKNIVKDIAEMLQNRFSLNIQYSDKIDYKDAFFGKSVYQDGPVEFVERILSSRYSIVSSFHGTVFSIIMEKNFFAVVHKDTGERVVSLLEKLGLEDRIIETTDDIDNIIKNDIDYSKVNEKLNQWRQESMEELKKICEL